MTRNELSLKIHNDRVAQGKWEHKLTYNHWLMQAIGELSMAVHHYEKNKYANIREYKRRELDPSLINQHLEFIANFDSNIRFTVESDLSYFAIRLLDLACTVGIDFDKSDVDLEDILTFKQPNFHNKSFCESAFFLTGILTDKQSNIKKKIVYALECLRIWTQSLSIDLYFFIDARMIRDNYYYL